MSMIPYSFQRRVAELLLDGRNVILQAPTGAGKTLAAMLPFLDAIEHKRDFPPQMPVRRADARVGQSVCG